MKFYMIANPGTLLKCDYAQRYPKHLVLAHEIYRRAAYAAAVRRLCIEKEVILDNGAYEGIVISPEVYGEMAENLQPWCTVLPDLIGQPSIESRKRSMEFAESHGGLKRLMYVPQGRCPEEVLDEYDWAIENLDSGRFIIGFGKAYELWGNGETARIRMVSEVFLHEKAKTFSYHILGARWKGTHVFTSHWGEYIIGIDSSKPCFCALHRSIYPMHINVESAEHSPRCADTDLLVKSVKNICAEYGIGD